MSAHGPRREVAAIVGRPVPPVPIHTHANQLMSLEDLALGWAVLYLFPGTVAHVARDSIHHRAFSRLRDTFTSRRIRVAGISSQSPVELLSTIVAQRIPHPLLSDPELRLAEVLGLPTCEHEERVSFARLTLVVGDQRIKQVFYPVTDAAKNPEQALTWIQLHK